MMLISEEEFQKRYNHLYNKTMQEAKDYAAHPDKLKREIELGKKKIDRSKLYLPSPDEYSYRMVYYRGFVQFPERLKNFIVAENESKSATRSFLPAIMDVEPNSRCNFRCIMCQVSGWKNGKRAEDLTFEEFKEFMDRGASHLAEVKLHGMGDPLINKEFFKMVRYMVERQIWVRTSINGSLLHINNNYKRLVDSGIGEVLCSFDGATKKVFETIRRNSNFELVLRNMTLLNDYANRKTRLYTRMWVVLQDCNRRQIFELVELAKKMRFHRLSFSVSLCYWGQEGWGKKNKKLQSRQSLSQEEKLRLREIANREGIDITIWEHAKKYSTESQHTLCPWPFNRVYISSDLRVVPCCMIANPKTTELGDAKDFISVWNSPAYQRFRQAHLDGDILQCCKGCYH